MQHPQTVVLAVDGSEHAYAAIQLLRSLPLSGDCRIHALSVLIPRQAQFATSFTQILEQTQAAFAGSAAEVHTELIAGYPAEVITQYAAERQADLIVMGAKGLRATLGILLGGTAQQVMEHAPCPSLIVRAPFGGLKRVLLVLDESEHARRAQDYLQNFALPQETQVDVLHVLQPTYPREILSQSWPPGLDLAVPLVSEELEAELRRQEEEEERKGKTLLEEGARALQARGIPTESFLKRGDAATKIIEHATERKCDLIVAGARGRGGLERLLLGSVSRKLIHYAPCSVLITRNVKGA